MAYLKSHIDVNSMIEFFKKFDPIEFKYSLFNNSSFRPKHKSKLANYEDMFQFGALSKQEYSSILDNLRLVYGNGRLVEEDITLYHIVEKKIIHQYLAIPELDKMFDEDYFNFEWDMHVGQNFQEHHTDYYRDHFIHQIRNSYMMYELLSKFSFFNATKKILSTRSASKISEYTVKKAKQFYTDQCSPIAQLLNNVLLTEWGLVTETPTFLNIKEDLSLFSQKYQKFFPNSPISYEYETDVFDIDLFVNNLSHSLTTCIEKIKTTSIEESAKNDLITTGQNLLKSIEAAQHKISKDIFQEYFYKYVIYSSSFLAALFHDMGYPICHFLDVRHRVSDYNPALYMFTQNTIESFDQLASKLSGSLLFTIVSHHEIKHSLQINKKGKYNHGAYSAIAFLLQFYESGIIHSLSPEKQCAIELAAIAIYNHTIKYDCVEVENDNNYYQPVFRQNPISFLLRICDDLQEWGRRYFEFSEESDLLVCSSCGVPIRSKVVQTNMNQNKKKYHCLCKEQQCTAIKNIYFSTRKMYIVTTAENLSLNVDKSILTVHINYDFYKLLIMAKLNNTYASYRLKELNEIKHLFKNQDLIAQSFDCGEYRTIFIDYFMSFNPILIKVKILESFLSKHNISIDSLNNYDATIKNIFEKLPSLNSFDDLKKYLQKTALPFYLELIELTKNNGEFSFDKLGKDNYYRSVMTALVEDCLLQYSKENQCKSLEDYLETDDYYTQYAPENKEYLLDKVARYCSAVSHFNNYVDFNKFIGYYTDLHFFELLNSTLECY